MLTARRPAKTKMIDPYTALIDAWLTKERRLQATVIHQRLVADHGFVGSYQRVKLYVAEARERLWPEPPELHRRFEVLPGAQAQVDWGDEGFLETPDGAVHVWSFHMTLSFSRDPFCCFVTSQDLVTFWDCHRRVSVSSQIGPTVLTETGPTRLVGSMSPKSSPQKGRGGPGATARGWRVRAFPMLRSSSSDPWPPEWSAAGSSRCRSR